MMKRFIVYDNLGAQLCEITPDDVIYCERREVINGEHSLTITTTQVLAKNQRIVYKDGRGYWREFVIVGVDEEHAAGHTVYGTYYCVWSLQVDMQSIIVSKMPGVQTPVTASAALAAILEDQSRWTRGTVTNTNTGGASMYDMSAWNAIGVLVENWGGEISATIGVSSTGVISRAVDLYAEMGESSASRRYDFGADLNSITRTISDEPYYCRISPRGKGEETEDGGYGRKITIESVNDGKDYLEYSPMVDIAKMPDGSSGYIYPTLIVENGDIETPAELKTWAQSVLESYCTPKVTYAVDVLQAGDEGVDVSGVSLGDTVQVVDKYFGDGLRLSGRVVELTVDELQSKNVTATIGALESNFASKFVSMDTVRDTVLAMNGGTLSTSAYLSRLIDRLNGEINATGGYTYFTEGQGIRTYDTAVSDPLVGAEASSVVEVKGGSIRIANSKTAQGAWEWKSVFTSGHIAADLVTVANIHAGFIGNMFGNYWDIDNGVLHTVSGQIGGFTIGQSALYNGTDAKNDDTHDGVYVGTDGLATVGTSTGNDKLRVTIDGGYIRGFKNGSQAGFISPSMSATISDGQGGTTTVPAQIIGGDALVIDVKNLAVGTDGDGSGTMTGAVTATGTTTSQNSYYSTRFVPVSLSNNVLTGYMRIVLPKYINGMFVGTTVNYWNTIGNGNIDIPLKAYVDAVDAKVPTFSLSGKNLFISL